MIWTSTESEVGATSRDFTGSYTLGLRILAGAFVAGGLLAISLRDHTTVRPSAGDKL